jgi:hypothetical protein
MDALDFRYFKGLRVGQQKSNAVRSGLYQFTVVSGVEVNFFHIESVLLC